MSSRPAAFSPARVGVTITSVAALVAAGLMFAVGAGLGSLAAHVLHLHASARTGVVYGDAAAFALASLVSSVRRHAPRLRRIAADR